MDGPNEKYTLVRAADGKLYAVAKNEMKPIEGQPNIDPAAVQHALDIAEDTVKAALMPLGSGVRVKVPQIWQPDQ